jgi:hypothetical protein
MNGIYLDAWDRHQVNIEVYNNLVERCGNGIIVGAENGGECYDINIHDNNIIDCRAGFAVSGWGIGESHTVHDIVFEKNTIIGASDNAITISNAGARNIRIVNNTLGGRSYNTDAIEMTKGVTAVDQSVVISNNALCNVGSKPSNLNGTDYSLLNRPEPPTNIRATGRLIEWDADGYSFDLWRSTSQNGYYKYLGLLKEPRYTETAPGTYWYKAACSDGYASSEQSAAVKLVVT